MNHGLRLAFSLLFTTPAFAQITPGNLIVVRVGTGAAALSNASTATFLDEFSIAGAPVQSIALPTTASGPNLPLSNNGTATSEAFVTQSEDGRYLVCAGYGTAPGTATVSSTTSAVVNRVVARIALDGTIDTTTALTDGFSASNVRSAATNDGSAFWVAGTAGAVANAGVRYAALGGTTSVQLSTAPTNIRVVNLFGGQLYCSSASGAFQGVSTVGTGLPTTLGQTTTILPGFPTATGPSNYDFFFADANTLYVADDRTNGSGGIQKWLQSGGTWTLAYTLAVTATSGCRGLSGFVDGGGIATLFATTTAASANTLVTVTDTGAGATFTTLATALANTAFRGVRFVRTPASLTSSGTACPTSAGVTTIGTAGGAPVTGNLGFQITAANTPIPTFVLFALKVGAVSPIGLPIPGAPACVEIYVLPDVLDAVVASPTGTGATALPIPANAALGGTQIGAQVVVFDFSLTGFTLPLGTSDALQITIGN